MNCLLSHNGSLDQYEDHASDIFTLIEEYADHFLDQIGGELFDEG